MKLSLPVFRLEELTEPVAGSGYCANKKSGYSEKDVEQVNARGLEIRDACMYLEFFSGNREAWAERILIMRKRPKANEVIATIASSVPAEQRWKQVAALTAEIGVKTTNISSSAL